MSERTHAASDTVHGHYPRTLSTDPIHRPNPQTLSTDTAVTHEFVNPMEVCYEGVIPIKFILTQRKRGTVTEY